MTGIASATEESTRDEAQIKCMVCLVEYQVDEELRTMPCLHYFHRECIDKWLLERGSTCPICKFNVRKDYNVTSAAQMSTNRRHSEHHSASGSRGGPGRHDHHAAGADFF